MVQQGLPNEHDAMETCMCQKVRVAARAMARTYDQALRPSGLRSTQFTILVAASVAGGISVGRLAAVLGLERTTLTRNLAVISKEGLVEVMDVDGRTRKVLISESGRERLRQALPLWDRAQQKIRNSLGEESWFEMGKNLGKLTRSAGSGE